MPASTAHDDEPLLEYRPLFAPDLLRGRVALVTGGGSGIGLRVAELFLRHGCSVACVSRSRARVEAAAGALQRATGGRCVGLALDVRDGDAASAVVRQVVEALGPIDVLVNAAAGNFLCPASQLSANAVRTVLAIDTVGTFNVSKEVYRQCFQPRQLGVIVNITATLHFTGTPLQAHASAAKAAIEAMSKSMAVEWGPDGVRVNCLAPGPIKNTEGFRRLGGELAEAAQAEMAGAIPLRRLGTRLDCAQGVLFLASDASSYVTGTTLVVDGGHWMLGASPWLAMMGVMHSKL